MCEQSEPVVYLRRSLWLLRNEELLRERRIMKVIVGLGNPGPKYSKTRHNTGFRVVEELARRYSIEKEQSKFDAVLAHLRIGNEKVLLVKPLTFMNLSGQAVQPLIKWYKISLDDLMVVYDDMDLDIGVLRIRASGGSGGHKGMNSIHERLGTQGFPRLRLGIGRPVNETIDWVLGHFDEKENEIMQKAAAKAADALECWVKEGIERAMNQYNQ